MQILLAACLGVRGPLNHAAQRLPASVPDQTFATAVVGSIRWFTKTCAHIVEQRRGIELLDPELFNERRAAGLNRKRGKRCSATTTMCPKTGCEPIEVDGISINRN